MEYTIEDHAGHRVKFVGDELAEVDTYTDRKPRWYDIVVYRTEGGSYVVHRTRYSAENHVRESCRGLAGTPIVADPVDHPMPCRKCGGGEYASDEIDTVQACRTVAEVIDYVRANAPPVVSSALLARLSEVDDDISAAWMEQVIE